MHLCLVKPSESSLDIVSLSLSRNKRLHVNFDLKSFKAFPGGLTNT